MPTSLLDAPGIAPLAHACIDKLVAGETFCYLDFPPELGMTEPVFAAIMEEIVLQVNRGHFSTVH